jgi:hypothetical protein
MLARQGRLERITAKMAEEDQRLERMAERSGTSPGAPRGRGGRGTMQQPEDQTTGPTRRPRRGR